MRPGKYYRKRQIADPGCRTARAEGTGCAGFVHAGSAHGAPPSKTAAGLYGWDLEGSVGCFVLDRLSLMIIIRRRPTSGRSRSCTIGCGRIHLCLWQRRHGSGLTVGQSQGAAAAPRLAEGKVAEMSDRAGAGMKCAKERPPGRRSTRSRKAWACCNQACWRSASAVTHDIFYSFGSDL